MDQIKIIVLAGGKGKRMNSELPKVLLPLSGVPMIKYLLKAVDESRIGKPATIVVGVGAEQVKEILGPDYNYVLQKEQLGTGHAVLTTEPTLRGKAKHIMVLYGDHPLMDTATIESIAKTHLAKKAVLTMGTIVVPDFSDWRAAFFDFGRIVRDDRGQITRSVETKDATEEERKMTEVNPCYYCFEAEWLWDNLKKISNDNAQKEYYLTDLPKLARDGSCKIASIPIEPKVGLGANTPAQFQVLAKFLKLEK